MAGAGMAGAAVGSMLPTISVGTGPEWRPQYTRAAAVVAVLHGAACAPCSSYRRRLEGAAADFGSWDGRLLVVAGADPAAVGLGPPPRVLVADRFGQVYHVASAGEAHAFAEPRELEEWLQFIATQCPE